ncbi:uncharacterized protein LOC111690488 [Lucilia cuprina]|uniref:uncharacterized protein LOC111690488 n=1 Tax=Lucilia cuprina TaxID=7375 RepID=UPI001F06BB1C|nr:uncharacterized protein LOC111690488 [Lucilia cuprina]
MAYKNVFNILVIFLATSVDINYCQESGELRNSNLSDALIRHARLRCLQQYPQADTINYSNSPETQCFLHCFLYRMGLMDLNTRGLNSRKFIDIWEKIEEAFEEDICLDRFDFSEPLSGKCIDTYRKLMEFRNNCLELFEYTFTTNSTWKKEDPKLSKKIGQSATEFCDFINAENIMAKETSQDEEVSLLTEYKEKLQCIFENIHYLDAYGRIDESEINLSYQEALEDSIESRDVVRNCSRRANAKYDKYYFGNMVWELQKCLKAQSPVYDKVYKLRDKISRNY